MLFASRSRLLTGRAYSRALPMLAAALTTLGLAALAPTARATVFYSGVVNIAVPNTSTGLYLNLINGTTYTGPSTFPTVGGPGGDYDFNIFGTTTWSLFVPGSSGQSAPTPVPTAQKGYMAATTTGAALNLTSGTTIGPTSTFNTGTAATTNIVGVGNAILGIRFRNENGGANTTHYGYVRLQLVNGQVGTLVDYGYETIADTAILAGATNIVVAPEPGALSLILVPATLGIARYAVRRGRTTV